MSSAQETKTLRHVAFTYVEMLDIKLAQLVEGVISGVLRPGSGLFQRVEDHIPQKPASVLHHGRRNIELGRSMPEPRNVIQVNSMLGKEGAVTITDVRAYGWGMVWVSGTL